MSSIDISRRRLAAAMLSLPLMPALAQGFPARPVRTVMPYSAGSGPDALVRAMTETIAQELGQPMVVDNKPGSNGWLAIADLKRTPADGYSVMMADANIMTLHQHLFKQLPFDPVRDFDVVTPLYATSYFVVVGASSPYRSLGELIAAARQQEGKVTYASWGMGSPGHIGAAMLEAGAGVKLHHVPYKDIPAVYVAVSTGEVDWAFGTAGSIAPMLKAGRIRTLAYTGTQRMPAHADVPTVAESGGRLSDFELSTWAAIYALKGTPVAATDRIRAGYLRALAEPAIRERLALFGFAPWTVARAEFEKVAAADSSKYRDIVRRANIALE